MSAAKVSEPEASYFGVQAFWGVTKHMGGLKATDELVELCHIDEGKYVLEVGSGVGMTACYIAKRHGCRVVGVDLSEGMVEWSRRRAKNDGLEDRVEFRVADAENLPFENDLFDAVISESVTVFVEEKHRAISEYARVTKPGGYVGLNEGTWMKASPPTDLIEYLHHTMAGANFLTGDDWRELLEGSQLRNIVARTYELNALSQWINELRGLTSRDLLDRVRAMAKFVSSMISSPAFRKYARRITPSRKTMSKFFEYLGYGIYVGRK